MPNSKLKSAAERLLIVANTLNNPADRNVARRYVDDLEKLAACEVLAPALPLAAPEDMRVLALSVTLRQAFPVATASEFDSLVRSLDH